MAQSILKINQPTPHVLTLRYQSDCTSNPLIKSLNNCSELPTMSQLLSSTITGIFAVRYLTGTFVTASTRKSRLIYWNKQRRVWLSCYGIWCWLPMRNGGLFGEPELRFQKLHSFGPATVPVLPLSYSSAVRHSQLALLIEILYISYPADLDGNTVLSDTRVCVVFIGIFELTSRFF